MATASIQTFLSNTFESGFSGYSGQGLSGFSGISGYSGLSGYSGRSGYSGASGATGISGYSGISGRGISGFSGSPALNWTKITTTTTGVNNGQYIADTSGGSFTLNLPASPVLGYALVVSAGSDLTINALTVGRNGSTIAGYTDDLLVDYNHLTIWFVFDGTTWQVSASSGPTGLSGYSGAGSGSAVTIGSDTTTNSDYYPLWANATAGVPATIYTSAGKLTFNPSTGTLSATELNSLSDITLKMAIKPIENPLDLLKGITGVNFQWRENGNLSAGLLAQEVERQMPELVKSSKSGKTVNYNGVVGLLVEAVKSLSQQLEDLRKRTQ